MEASMATMRFSASRFRSIARFQSITASFGHIRGIIAPVGRGVDKIRKIILTYADRDWLTTLCLAQHGNQISSPSAGEVGFRLDQAVRRSCADIRLSQVS